jgi:hypothetical protein
MATLFIILKGKIAHDIYVLISHDIESVSASCSCSYHWGSTCLSTGQNKS